MAKKKVTEQSNQLNLTVVALVALVAIVGLVALVLQSANLANVPTGMQQASAEDMLTAEDLEAAQNLVGDAKYVFLQGFRSCFDSQSGTPAEKIGACRSYIRRVV